MVDWSTREEGWQGAGLQGVNVETRTEDADEFELGFVARCGVVLRGGVWGYGGREELAFGYAWGTDIYDPGPSLAGA